MTLGDLVKKYREKHNISMDEFSKMCSLSKGYISMLENNTNPRSNKPIAPTLPTIKKIASAMNTDVDSILKTLDIDQEISLDSKSEEQIFYKTGIILNTENANKEPPEIKYYTIENNTAVVAEEAKTYGVQMINPPNYDPLKESIYHKFNFVPIDETMYKENTDSSFINRLFKYYEMLNDIGKDVAIKRVEELTYVPEYANEVDANPSIPLKKSDTSKSKATNKAYKNSKK